MAKPVREEFQFGQRVLESEAWSVTWWCTESEAWSVTWWCTESEAWSVTWWCTETIVHTWASCTATDLYEGGFASGHLYHSAAKGPDVSLKHTTTVSCTLAPNTATMQQSLLRMSHRHRKVIFCLKINSSYSFWSRRVNILTCNPLSFPPQKTTTTTAQPRNNKHITMYHAYDVQILCKDYQKVLSSTCNFFINTPELWGTQFHH